MERKNCRMAMIAVLSTSIFLFVVGLSFASTFEAGGDFLISTQLGDGGWEWDLGSGASSTNQASPGGMGLLATYKQTGEIQYLNQAIVAGEYIITNSPTHHTQQGIFMNELSQVTGDSKYADAIKSTYYDSLAAGTFEKNGTDYDTASYAQYILDVRATQGNNLALWDLGTAAYGAVLLGSDQSDLFTWGDAIETGLNAWDSGYNTSRDGALLGLAGGILGLSGLGRDLDAPIFGGDVLDGARTASDLADILLTYQTGSGGFANYPDYAYEPYTSVQTTAFAIIALTELDSHLYDIQINAAASWLRDVQLGNGGWSGAWAGVGVAKNEVTGEALWAVNAAVPEPGTILLLGLGLMGIAGLGRKKLTE